jgi:hypothetical protein
VPERSAERTRHRTPCVVTIAGRRHNGLVLDFSRTGLYIQTSAKPEIGDRLDISLTLHGRRLPMHVQVARRKAVPPQLRTVAHGGIGVRILSAPEEFYQLLIGARGPTTGGGVSESMRRGGRSPLPAPIRAGGGRASESEPPDTDPDERAPDESLPQFRVRVRQVTGSRTRTLRVFASDRDAAVEEASRQVGEAWKVLEVEPVDPA